MPFIAKKKEKSRAEFALSSPPPFFTVGKSDYKRECAASEMTVNSSKLLGLLSTSPCENSIKTKHSLRRELG